MKLSLIIEAQDRASQPVGRVEDGVGGLGATVRKTTSDVRALDRQMDRTTRSAGGLERAANDNDRALHRMDRSASHATRTMGRLERAARGVGNGLAAASRRGIGALSVLGRRLVISRTQMEKLAFSAGSLIGSTIRGGVLAGGAIAGAGVTAAIYKVISAGLANENYRTQLNGLEGSEEAGRRAFGWVTEFAKKTPYEMTEVMEAFIALKAYGIDPTNGTLEMLGNTAAGMGKGLMQAVEMLADAQTGEFERMKEFGVKASVEGDKVTLRWQQNGKEMSKTVKQSATAIREAMSEIMGARFSGGMERLAQTTSGKWSNLMDNINQTAARVWETSFGPAVNRQLDRLLETIGRMEKDGSLKKWADETSQSMADMVEILAETDWTSIAAGVGAIASAAAQTAAALGRAVSALQQYRYESARRTVQGRLDNGWFVGDEERGRLRQQLDNLDRQYGGKKTAPYKGPQLRSGLRGYDRPTKPLPANRPPVRPTSLLAKPAAPTAAKGKLEISIKTDKGTTAKTTKLAATGIDVDVATGRGMGGFA